MILQLIAVQTRSFWQYELGQIMCAFAETFIVSLPARVAAVWFPSDEISTATSIGVFGNQLGVALSFKLPTTIVTGPINSSTVNATSEYYQETDEAFRYWFTDCESQYMRSIIDHQCWTVFEPLKCNQGPADYWTRRSDYNWLCSVWNRCSVLQKSARQSTLGLTRPCPQR